MLSGNVKEKYQILAQYKSLVINKRFTEAKGYYHRNIKPFTTDYKYLIQSF